MPPVLLYVQNASPPSHWSVVIGTYDVQPSVSEGHAATSPASSRPASPVAPVPPLPAPPAEPPLPAPPALDALPAAPPMPDVALRPAEPPAESMPPAEVVLELATTIPAPPPPIAD